MSIWPSIDPPKTGLARYRVLSPSAGVHVSPIQLGAMSIGDKYAAIGMGAMDKESSFKLLDAYYEAGGNFIDTANAYQFESSEQFVGEWMELRGVREQLVIATKYTTGFKSGNAPEKQKVSFTGNNLKSMRVSVDASLRKLRTSYIDIFYLHWWDHSCSVAEVMNGLYQLVLEGKVLYLGISDSPAWVVTKANQYARDHGMSPFVIYQGAWNLMKRDFEREIIPMARSEGMALAPWAVLAAGKIRTDEEEEARLKSGEKGRMIFSPEWQRTENERKVCKALEQVAKEVGAKSIQAVAIAYVMQKTPYVFPIIGMRKVEQMEANLEALEISLSAEQIAFIEGIVPFELGFPHEMIGNGDDTNPMITKVAHIDRVPNLTPIRPAGKNAA